MAMNISYIIFAQSCHSINPCIGNLVQVNKAIIKFVTQYDQHEDLQRKNCCKMNCRFES